MEPSGKGAPPPVRIKLYGLIRVSRRGYLRLLLLGAVLLLVVLVLWAVWVPPPLREHRPLHWSERLLRGLHAYLPWVVLAAVVLEAVEAFFVLRRFAREEAARRGRPPDPNS